MAEKDWGEKEIFIRERGEGGVSKDYKLNDRSLKQVLLQWSTS